MDFYIEFAFKFTSKTYAFLVALFRRLLGGAKRRIIWGGFWGGAKRHGT
jgi:hypothetical protein